MMKDLSFIVREDKYAAIDKGKLVSIRQSAMTRSSGFNILVGDEQSESYEFSTKHIINL